MRSRAGRARPARSLGLEHGAEVSPALRQDHPLAAIGHNGAPSDLPRQLPYGASCARCHHWEAPSDRDVRDYEAFQRGVGKRRVREPSGFCHRILHSPGGRAAAGGCVARSFCFNFEDDQRLKPEQDRRGFVTIYEGGRIVWQGTEGDEPAEFRQAELDL